MAKKKSATTKDGPAQFEKALQRLEAIVEQLEDGEIGLDQALGQYEQGVKCLRQCYGLLDEAERRIRLVTNVDDQGNLESVDYQEDSADSLQKKGAARSRRRSGNSSTSPKEGGSSASIDVDSSGRLF